jgi:hypothetical protein
MLPFLESALTLPLSRDMYYTGLTMLYGSSLPGCLATMLGMVREHIFRELCLEGHENPGVPPPHLPQVYRSLLASLEHDPVLGALLRQPQPAKQWQQLLAFAERCELAYQQGYQAIKAPFIVPSIDHQCALFVQRMLADAQRWRISAGDGMSSYETEYSEETECQVMRQWYQYGYSHSLTEQEAVQRAVWHVGETMIVPPEDA